MAAASPALKTVPKRMTLFEHVNDVEGIASMLFELDDTDTTPEREKELCEALIAACAGTRSKVDRTAGQIGSFESARDLAKAEADRYKKRAARMERCLERLEKIVLAVLEASRLEQLDGDTNTLKRAKNPPKVDIVCEADIPVAFLRRPEPPPPPDTEPDKNLIKAALKVDPASVPGAKLVQGFRLVRS